MDIKFASNREPPNGFDVDLTHRLLRGKLCISIFYFLSKYFKKDSYKKLTYTCHTN